VAIKIRRHFKVLAAKDIVATGIPGMESADPPGEVSGRGEWSPDRRL